MTQTTPGKSKSHYSWAVGCDQVGLETSHAKPVLITPTVVETVAIEYDTLVKRFQAYEEFLK